MLALRAMAALKVDAGNVAPRSMLVPILLVRERFVLGGVEAFGNGSEGFNPYLRRSTALFRSSGVTRRRPSSGAFGFRIFPGVLARCR